MVQQLTSSQLRFQLVLALVLMFVAAGGCGKGADTPEPASETDERHDAIAWFDGSPDAAFALAKSERKPVFLYWGADWCPPCQYLKNKVFTRPEFVEKSKDFVTVYLDADMKSAQYLGDKFGISGYPTAIILSPDGEEVMRMPSSIPVQEYAVALDSAMQRMRPVETVLTEVMEAGPANADATDLNILAFYSWIDDRKFELKDEERAATFKRLYQETPDELMLEKSRFLALYLEALIEQSSDGEKSPLTDEERAKVNAALMALLDDERLVGNNLGLLSGSRKTVELLHPEDSPDRRALMAQWVEAAQRVENDETLPIHDRLDAIDPQIQLAEGEAAIYAELQDHVRERIAWAGAAVTDEGELQAVLFSMASLLASSGLEDEAGVLVTQMMDEATAPYYFMMWMGSREKKDGNPEEALLWFRKSYQNSPVAHFRWGLIYLRNLVELAPEDEMSIETESLDVLAQLLTFDGAFAGDSYGLLGLLESDYRSWNEDGTHDESLSRIRAFVHQACERYPAEGEDSARERCAGFLAEEDTEPV